MTVRRGLVIGGCIFAASWFLPPAVGYFLAMNIGQSSAEWGFLGAIVLGILVGWWMQGMMWGASVLVPLSAWMNNRNPRISVRRVLAIGLIIWAIPAYFVSSFANHRIMWAINRKPPAEAPRVRFASEEETKEYRKQIVVTIRLDPDDPEHFAVEGKLENNGDRTVRVARLVVHVTDAWRREVAWDHVDVVDYHTQSESGRFAPLLPGETREFSAYLYPPLRAGQEVHEPLTVTYSIDSPNLLRLQDESPAP